jgi:F-box-like
MLCWSLLRQVAPIDTLPVELIAYIFVLATHTTDYETASSSEAVSININSITVPLVLSTVNKRWRNIALSTSALWTTLCVTIQDIVYHNDDLALKLPALDATQLVTYLSLSRKYPVDILIDARDPDWDFSENECVIGHCRQGP